MAAGGIPNALDFLMPKIVEADLEVPASGVAPAWRGDEPAPSELLGALRAEDLPADDATLLHAMGIVEPAAAAATEDSKEPAAVDEPDAADEEDFEDEELRSMRAELERERAERERLLEQHRATEAKRKVAQERAAARDRARRRREEQKAAIRAQIEAERAERAALTAAATRGGPDETGAAAADESLGKLRAEAKRLGFEIRAAEPAPPSDELDLVETSELTASIKREYDAFREARARAEREFRASYPSEDVHHEPAAAEDAEDAAARARRQAFSRFLQRRATEDVSKRFPVTVEPERWIAAHRGDVLEVMRRIARDPEVRTAFEHEQMLAHRLAAAPAAPVRSEPADTDFELTKALRSPELVMHACPQGPPRDSLDLPLEPHMLGQGPPRSSTYE